MGNIHIAYSLGGFQSAVDHALEKMRKNSVIERIWAKDYTLWKPAPDEITDRLGWLDAPEQTLKKIDYIYNFSLSFICFLSRKLMSITYIPSWSDTIIESSSNNEGKFTS